MTTHNKFALGDTAAWVSKAQGTERTKRGTIVAVIPHSVLPSPSHNITSAMGRTRDHESYVVEVEQPPPVTRDSSGPMRKVRYWPRVISLNLVGKGQS